MVNKDEGLKEPELLPGEIAEPEEAVSPVEDKTNSIPQPRLESKSVTMEASASMAEAGRSKLKQFLEKLQKSEEVIQEGTDPEGVHEMRVATRRLRAGLKVMEETVYEPRVTRKFRRDLRHLANLLGGTRDSDVFLEHLDDFLKIQPLEKISELEAMREILKKQNVHNREAMLVALNSKKVKNSLERLGKFVNTPGAGVRKIEHQDNEVTPLLVKHFVGSIVWKNYEAILAYDTSMPAPVQTLHRLRVAFKHLRYTLNFFEEAMPESTKLLIKHITEAQNYLGELNDHQVGINLAAQVLKKHPENVAVQLYREERLVEMERMAREFPPLWEKLTGQNFRSRLAGALAKIA